MDGMLQVLEERLYEKERGNRGVFDRAMKTILDVLVTVYSASRNVSDILTSEASKSSSKAEDIIETLLNSSDPISQRVVEHIVLDKATDPETISFSASIVENTIKGAFEFINI